ncbi:hypothetical protein M4V62_18905 [Streptomyces durmitorensis]|uniref:Lipoprotein n=1 Tax=Streptomyces durmitorensis TaxID=319947 RepID=A0ABY4PVM2_9ACTN|nr:hypothetical protein [Streptomyces durmitorensis]UQT57003.1 hypothetical protein M4V62_18905 [Streptomyces durmitorensis]
MCAVALLVVGCGGGAEPQGSDEIPGVGQGAEKAPTKASAAPGDGIARPRITLPEGDQLVFDPQETGDARTDAVLRDNAEYLRAVDEAIGDQKPKSKAVAFYSKGSAYLDSVEWIGGFVKEGNTVTGTVRYVDRRVTFGEDGSVGLTYCGDESKGYTKDLKTKKTNVTPVTEDSYVFYNDRLRKNAKGVWQVTKSVSERGSKACRP